MQQWAAEGLTNHGLSPGVEKNGVARRTLNVTIFAKLVIYLRRFDFRPQLGIVLTSFHPTAPSGCPDRCTYFLSKVRDFVTSNSLKTSFDQILWKLRFTNLVKSRLTRFFRNLV